MSRFLFLLAAVALSAACVSPQRWWQQDLQEWEGAPVSELLDAWGPPMRTLTGAEDTAVLVYESIRQLDHRLEALRDPGARLRPDSSEGAFTPMDRSECTLHFEIAAEHVVAARHEGSACEIVPRDPARRRVDPSPSRRR